MSDIVTVTTPTIRPIADDQWSEQVCAAAQARINGLADILNTCETREGQLANLESALYAADMDAKESAAAVTRLTAFLDAGFEAADELDLAIAALDTHARLQHTIHTYLVDLDEQVREGGR